MQARARQIALKIQESVKRGFFAEHEYRVLPPGSEGFWERAFYQRTQQLFAQEGFVHLGDLEDASIARLHRVRAVIRVMVDSEATTSAAFYRVHPPIWQRALMRLAGARWNPDVVEIESSLDDGVFLSTTNATADVFRTPERIQREILDGAGAADLLRAHRLRLQAYQRMHPQAGLVPRRTLEDHVEAQREIDRLKAEDRAARSYSLDWDEFMQLGGDRLQEELRQAVWRELRALALEELGRSLPDSGTAPPPDDAPPGGSRS